VAIDKLPENLTLIHSITTDDAFGIEAYWHKRFKHRNTKGEWVILLADDVKAFKRRVLSGWAAPSNI
jgi:hypothetical protein